MSRSNQAFQKISQFFSENEYAIKVLHSHLKRVQEMPGANHLFNRIASTTNKEQLEDYLAEVSYWTFDKETEKSYRQVDKKEELRQK